MPTIRKETETEQDKQTITISRLTAALRLPNVGRNNVLYLGWSEGNTPILSWDKTELSDAAIESLNITKTVKLSSDVSVGDRIIEPVQYMTALPSIDKPDTEDEYSEDVLVLGVVNSQGMTDYIHIEELDLMEGILTGHVVWQDVNTHTLMGDQEVTPTLPMHSVFLPIEKDDGKRVMLAMLFEPTMNNESNEPAFKLFLSQMMKSFLALDARQPQDARKGYEKVLRDFQESQGVGGDAYVVMKTLKDLGLTTNITRDRLEQIWRESAGKSFTYQLMLLAREFGLLNFDVRDSAVAKGQLDKMDVDGLLDLMNMCRKVVNQTFRRGK